MKNIDTLQKTFVGIAKDMFGETKTEVSRKEVIQMINDKGAKYPVWLLKSPTYRIGRGQYKLPTFEETMSAEETISSTTDENVSE